MKNICTPKASPKLFSFLKLSILAITVLFVQPAIAQYCPPDFGDGCSFNSDIDDFTITGVVPSVISDMNTGCGVTSVGYDDRTTVVAAVDLMQGGSYPGTITTDAGWDMYYTIWIDFDNSQTFDASEDMTGLVGWYNSNNPSNFSLNIPLSAATGQHRMRVRTIPFASGPIDPCAFVWEGEVHDYLVNILQAPPCATPVITGVAPAGPINSCSGASQTLQLNISPASGYSFQWQISTSGGGGGTWSNISGATNQNYTFAITGTADYRVYVVCANGGLSDTSVAITVNAVPATFAALPFFEDFETWQDYCSDNDVPTAASGTTWTNQPATGDNSWRREDEGNTAGWSVFWGSYFPNSVSGSHSARFSSASVSNSGAGPGNLDLYLDCSTQTGGKQLYFYYISGFSSPPGDELNVLLSDNGGSSFTQIGTFSGAQSWTKQTLPIASNSAQTIIRFQGNVFNFDFADMGLDSVYVAPPCTGAPVAGVIDPAGPMTSCPGKTSVLTNLGGSLGGNIQYDWQQSTDLGVTWTTALGGSGNGTGVYTTSGLYDTTYFRLVVTCLTSGTTDTTPVVEFYVAPPQFTPVPFFEDFENWISFCANQDAPTQYWLNNPSTGDSSWRRDDEGNTANWFSWANYSPASISGAHSARFPAALLGFNGGEGRLDLNLDCSGQTGGKQLYFYLFNQYGFFSPADSLTVFLSDNGGVSFTQIGSFDTSQNWSRKSLPIASNSAQTIVSFRAKVLPFSWGSSDMGIDSVYVAPPCTGTPVAGYINPAGPLNSCAGRVLTFTNIGGSMAGNLQYDWEQSTNGGASWGPVVGGSGNGTAQYTTDPLFSSISYRLTITCLGSNQSVTTATVDVNVTAPVYAALPHTESFENWFGFCDNQDVPSSSWLNNPATTDMSWRREDEGATANWNGPGNGGYTPASIEGNHSARIHTSAGFWGGGSTTNDFDLFVDCSAPGVKELQFHYINPQTWSVDQLDVSFSDDAGATFNNLTTLFGGIDQWTLQTIPFNSTSATTIIRFSSTADWNDDMGMDNLKVLLPCDAQPVAGTVDSLTPCSGQDFFMSLSGTTLAGGLTYQWQESTDGVTWTDIAGATNSISTHNITAATYIRCIVTCSANGLTDTSDERLIELAEYLYCYCESFAQSPNDDDIGNVMISKVPSGAIILNNGIATPLQSNPTAINGYTNYTSVAPTPLYKDSTYTIGITHITSSSFFNDGLLGVWIDYNQDGTFDPFGEQVLFGSTTLPTQQALGNFTVPNGAPVGPTGMRVVLVPSWSFPNPCGSYFNGETEDYIVQIDYQPCNGSPNAGTAEITDTLLCPGFPFTLTDTSYEKQRGGLVYVWQSSTDGVSWTDIAGSAGEDTLNQISGTANTYYRFKMTCTNSNSESFSNVLNVKIKPYFQCYCPSYADGGAADESDAGVFTIGNYVFNTGGGHLNNPGAVKAYTDNTNADAPIWLAVDSTYNITVLHTIKSNNNQDAKITLFMDFNNNKQYDIPQERVWTGFSNSTSSYLTATVQIPADAVRNVVSGMRLIVNNDINANVPSDEACGTYTSGETEDYTVEFKNWWELSVGNVNGGDADMQLYPNPTTGKFTVSAQLPSLTDGLELSITDVNGRLISVYEYKPNSKAFQTELNMSGKTAGIYFVTLKAGAEKIVRKLIVQ